MVTASSELKPSWMDPYIAFLSDKSVLNDTKEDKKVRRTIAHFLLFDDRKLFRCSFGGSYLLCLHPNKTTKLLAELHEGLCNGHLGGRSLAHRAMTQGFRWQNMQREAVEYVKRYDRC